MDVLAGPVREGDLRGSAVAAAILVLAGAPRILFAAPAGAPSPPRLGRAELGLLDSFTTAAGKTARRRGLLDGSVTGRFGPGGGTLAAAFVRVEVTSRWPLVTGADVRDNSGYNLYLVAPDEAERGARIASRVRIGDSTYRLVAPRAGFASFAGTKEPELLEKLPDRAALSAEDLDGDGADEILAFFQRQLPMSARPEIRLEIFRIEGRAIVDLASIPIVVPDVSEDFDFWGYMVGGVEIARSPGGAGAISVSYARTASAEDQRTDAGPPRDLPPRTYTFTPLPGR